MTKGTARLYTPELLALTVRLAEFPLAGEFADRGSARSRSCGSTLEIGLDRDAGGAITRIGIRAQACAVGQAAAALFAHGAAGRDAGAIADALAGMERWLAGESEPPQWPGLELLEPARDYPGRHGAILLAWQAAAQALSQPVLPG